MKQLAGISVFLTRVMFCSLLALACQIFLVVRYPDLMLTVQEWVKQASISTFEEARMASAYRVAYNLLNGDGILVHTLFVMLAFLALYLLFTPLRLLIRPR